MPYSFRLTDLGSSQKLGNCLCIEMGCKKVFLGYGELLGCCCWEILRFVSSYSIHFLSSDLFVEAERREGKD